ncbi:MAG: proline dehydrogenase family protein [Thermodesulfobacteriota bacterium]
MTAIQDIERKTDEIQRSLYSLVRGEVPSLFDTGTWKGKVMEWAMRDESVKIPLFRFIDALPSVTHDSGVVRLLNEYFENVQDSPLVIKRGLRSLAGTGILPSVAGRIIRSRVASFGRQFIAGRDAEDAENALRSLRDEGLAFTIDLLGEEALSGPEIVAYQRRYLHLIDSLARKTALWPQQDLLDNDHVGPIPRVDVSVKVSSFFCHLDPVHWEESVSRAKEGLSPVIEKAEETGASVTLDMEHYYLKDLTIDIFKSLLEDHPALHFGGIALQAYLKEAEQDVVGLVRWARSAKRRISVRLVKGAYWDYETVVNRQRGWPIPVYLQKSATDRSFEDLTRILLENVDAVRPAIATHNLRSISHAIAVADSLGLPRNALEFQVIYGMAEPIRSALKKFGFRVRVYTPVGELIPGMAYLIRRLLENTSNESFLRQTFFEQAAASQESAPPDSSPQEIDLDRGFRNEPLLDFSRADNRRRMNEALESVRRRFGSSFPLIVGANEISTGQPIVSRNPADQSQIVGTVSSATAEHAEAAVRAARSAWISWRRTPPEERAAYLRRTAASMRSHRFELAALEVFEVGKPWKEADADVTEAIDFLEYYAAESIRLGTPRRLGAYPGEKNLYVYEPRGVGVAISPWNFPLAIPTGLVSAGVGAGNCVIFKPSGLSSVLGWHIVNLFREAGLPPGVLQFLPGPGGEVGEYLVSHPDVDFIAFTGSKEVGLKIVELAAKAREGQRSIKRVIAELGGKNAIIVDETADLDEAIKGVVESALGYQGQKCSACSRVIVVGDSFEEFCSRLAAAVDSVPIGRPEDPSSLMGPLVSEEAVRKVQSYIALGKRDGKLLYERDPGLGGLYVGPAMFTGLPLDSPLLHEEIFGPVIALVRAGDLDEAIDISNSTSQALTGGIYSRSPASIEKAQAQLRVGNLYINRKITGALVARQPFGGMAMSGVGTKTGGPDYLQQFMNVKSISENTLRRGFAAE